MTQFPGAGPSGGFDPSSGGVPQRPQRGVPAWAKWLVGGCAGCAVVLIIGMAVGGFALMNLAKKTGMMVPVTEVSARKDLGADVPFYPKSTFSQSSSQGLLAQMRTREYLEKKKPGDILKGVIVRTTTDTHDQVLTFYDRELKKAGWTKEKSLTHGSSQQNVYRKGKELVAVIVSPAEKDNSTEITVMRGGPKMTEYYTDPTGRQ